MGTSVNTNQSLLERQLRITEEVSKVPGGLSFTQIQRVMNMSKATTHRLVKGLCEVGLLVNDHNGGRLYRLGPRLTNLLGQSISPDRIVPIARPILRELVDAFGETAFLAMLRNGRVETITMVTPVKDWQGHVHPGRIMPAHAAASAKAIFAFQDPASWQAVLKPPLQRFTANTMTSTAAVRREYANVRREGIARCHEEIDPGQMALAAPIQLDTIGTLLSVCVVGPSDRMASHSIEHILGRLQATAAELAEAFVDQIQHFDEQPS